jgi:predicted regulator of Ras-like GTPase activity (Roadblock/LC7/MglB family)
MALPQLIAEDVRELDRLLGELVARSEASAAVLIDKAGFLITQAGNFEQFDFTTLSALAAGSFAATQGMASVINEPNFNSVYQQGENFSLLVQNLETDTLLLVVFAVHVSVGAVKYFSNSCVPQLVEQFLTARRRNPNAGIDLAMMNMEDSSAFFRKVADAS